MSAALPGAHRAIMAGRREPPDSLDFFPTPPWAARQFANWLAREESERDGPLLSDCWAHDPCCGEGHLMRGLGLCLGPSVHDHPVGGFGKVTGSDLFDYRRGFRVADAFDVGRLPPAEWLITNPPFGGQADLPRQLVEQWLDAGHRRIAMLVGLTWLAGQQRRELFQRRPPAVVVVHAERVPMLRGKWDPDASTATLYCWVVWSPELACPGMTRLEWLPPARARFDLPEDRDPQLGLAWREPAAAAPLLERGP